MAVKSKKIRDILTHLQSDVPNGARITAGESDDEEEEEDDGGFEGAQDPTQVTAPNYRKKKRRAVL